MSNDLPNVSRWLTYDPMFMAPEDPRGLWFCDGPESVLGIQINAVCLAADASWDDLAHCEAFVSQFQYVLVVCPDPARRESMVNEIRRRLISTAVLVAQDKAFRGCRTIQSLRETYGLKALDQILLDVVELPVYGLLDLADVRQPDFSQMPKVLSGISLLDQAIGGFLMGELSVWTGRRGEGKSTLLEELLLEARDQGETVCAYSGELPAWKFKYWTSLQAAGPDNIRMERDKRSGRQVPVVTELAQAQIDEWFRREFFLYDIGHSSVHDAGNILRLFEYAHHWYGARVFLVDNIMTARFKGSKDADYYRAQSNFVNALATFARKNGVHVHLVAHPRKTEGKHLAADDVGGIGDITNFADNVFALERAAKKKEQEGDVEMHTVLNILKNRFFGVRRQIGLDFDETSKRFYKSGSGSPAKRFSWEFAGDHLKLTEIAADPDDPFPEA